MYLQVVNRDAWRAEQMMDSRRNWLTEGKSRKMEEFAEKRISDGREKRIGAVQDSAYPCCCLASQQH